MSPPGPRILYVTPYWPQIPGSASESRAAHIGRALQQIGDVDVLLVDAECRNDDAQSTTEARILNWLPVQPAPPKGLLAKLQWAFNPRSMLPHGPGVDKDWTERVVQTAEQYDLVWFFKLRTANMFPHVAWRRSVLDIDNLPSTYERSLRGWKRPASDQLKGVIRAFSWTRRERLLDERFTLLVTCSETDAQYLGTLGVRSRVHVIPNGFDRPSSVPVRTPANPPRIGFIGVFDYEPNVEGIRWFVTHCWSRIKREIPDARLRLVGRHNDEGLKPLGTDIDALGWLPDPAPEMMTWTAMIVPILAGSGTRGKIAHGFAIKCPIVATPIGAYGYGAVDGREIFLADSPERFASACITAIRQPQVAEDMAERAWEMFNEKWSWDAIQQRIVAVAEDCLRRR